MNRYEATRRRHPLAPADRVVEGIRKERLMMEQLRGDADLVIDTSGLTPARAPRPGPGRVRRRAARRGAPGLAASRSASSTGLPATPTCCSTSGSCRTRTGSPSCDRCPGPTPEVKDYVTGQQAYAAVHATASRRCSTSTVPGFIAEGKSYLTVAIGLHRRPSPGRGGREELAEYFRKRGLPVTVEHRDVERRS